MEEQGSDYQGTIRGKNKNNVDLSGVMINDARLVQVFLWEDILQWECSARKWQRDC